MKFKINFSFAKLLVVATAFVSAYADTGLEGEGGSIDLSLTSKWASGPLSLEILELIRKFDDKLYPHLFEEFVKDNVFKLNDKKSYEYVIEKIKERKWLSKDQLQLFELSLGLRSSLPIVQAYYQFYNLTVVPEFSKLNSKFDDSCLVWIHFEDEQHCQFDLFSKKLEASTSTFKPKLKSSQALPFEINFETPKTELPTVTLYADLTSPEFPTIHKNLKDLSESNKINYRLRYLPNSKILKDTPYLSGYGAQLWVKSTEYQATDDRKFDSETKEDSSLHRSEYTHYNNTLIDKLTLKADLDKVNEEDLKDIGKKFTQSILKSQSLPLWIYLTQNAPKHLKQISSKELKKKVCNGVTVPSGYYGPRPAPDMLQINGITIPLEDMDIFRLVDLLLIEKDTVSKLKQLGVTDEDAVQFLESQSAAVTANSKGDSQQKFDVRDSYEDNKAVLWLNDLETEPQYKSWPNTLDDLVNGIGYSLPEVKKNYATVILAVDLTKVEMLETLVTEIAAFIENLVPVRFGLVVVSDPEHTEAQKLNHHLRKVYTTDGSKGLRDTLKAYYAKVDGPQAWETLVKKLENGAESYDELQKYVQRLKLNKDQPSMFVNGVKLEFAAGYQRELVGILSNQLKTLASEIGEGKIQEDTNLYDYYLNQSGVFKRYNKLTFSQDDFIVDYLSQDAANQTFLDKLHYIEPETEEPVLPTAWLITDLNKPFGKALVTKLLEASIKINTLRTLVLHNGQSKGKLSETFYNFQKELKPKSAQLTLKDIEGVVEDNTSSDVKSSQYWNDVVTKLKTINIDTNKHQLIVNGKIFFLDEEDINEIDLVGLIDYDFSRRLKPTLDTLTHLNATKVDSDLFMKASGIVGRNLLKHKEIAKFEANPGYRKRRQYDSPNCRLDIGSAKGSSWAQFSFVLDPIGDHVYKWLPILETLSRIEGINIEGYLNPSQSDPKLISKRFYRYVLQDRLSFDTSSGEVIPATAYFSQLPKSTLLTAGLEPVQSWLVSSKKSHQDLDNLILSDKNLAVSANYQLTALLIEGHALDSDTQGAARGVQFQLKTPFQQPLTDTIVMANLGYFQLQASPGLFELDLRDGVSKDVFDLTTLGSKGYANRDQLVEDDTLKVLAVTSFKGATLFPKVSKKPGKTFDLEQLYGQTKQEESLWSKFKSQLGQSTQKDKDDVINVFTVASGHLYERFLAVMVRSVLKNTKSKVKFWFVDNFLSPSFRDDLPKLAKHFNFDYAFVTYQWPHWLNPQTEKQRIIWGYKILFLDVLFPLDVNKVIFVDADQVVRADLKELIDHDLNGAPYGYVPFCQSRESMKGYRFWEQGYWANHLNGKPYHISALYVVDLIRFRALAAGDQLRGHYQMLSQDANSLANLDQDLPNHLQPRLPIHSLPVEWLWCETWCDDKSLANAKTIDLCNNPETKEPKLDRAKRILPEWQLYDEEVQQVLYPESKSDTKVDGNDKDEL